MNRIVRMIAAAVVGTAALSGATALAGTAATAPVSGERLPLILKHHVVVGGSTIRLSDVFVNVPKDNDGAIADSPIPGDRLIFGARQLLQYTSSFGLKWQPRDIKEYVEVVRDSMPVPSDLVRDALVKAITAQRSNDDFEIVIYNRDLPLFVATDKHPEVVIRNLVYDPRRSRFDASVTVAGSQAAPVMVTGRVDEMVTVPVLRDRAMPGDVIAKTDVVWGRVEARRVGMNTVTRFEDVVGSLPRRPIAAGEVLRFSDLRPNFVVDRGDVVTIVFKSGSMTLTARAEALERGAIGNVIRVRNNQSKKVLETRVTAAGTVTLVDAQTAALN